MIRFEYFETFIFIISMTSECDFFILNLI